MMRFIFGIYRVLISPTIHVLAGPGMGCRFEPSCSAYAKEALEKKGYLRGSKLAFQRILRCNPWSRGGWDPVP